MQRTLGAWLAVLRVLWSACRPVRGRDAPIAGGFARTPGLTRGQGGWFESCYGVGRSVAGHGIGHFKPNTNWIIRPELRYDWYDGQAGLDNAGKHWAQPDDQTPAGNGLLVGWWKAAPPSTDKIQTVYRLHQGDQIDYASMPHLVQLS